MSYRDTVQRVLVVDCPVMQQIERVQQRSSFARSEVERIVDSQIHRRLRLQLADDVLVNVADIDSTSAHIAALHAFYLEQAGVSA